MSGITFPAPPHTNGDTHIAENGVIYTWQDGGWMANQVSGLDDTYVNRKGDDMTGDLTIPSLNSGPLAGFRNQIINGGMDFWQRGEPVEFAGSGYGADRWGKVNSSTGSTVAFNRTTAHGFPGLTYACNFTTDTDLSNVRIRQPIELFKQGYAGQFVGEWTLSWYTSEMPDFISIIFSSDLKNSTPGAGWTEDPSGIQTLGNNRYCLTFTAASSVQSTDKCALVSFKPPIGSTSWNLSGVQLEPGPVATPFEHRPIGTELALCQRYFFRMDITGLRDRNYALSPYNFGNPPNNTMNSYENFPVTMRVPPTVFVGASTAYEFIRASASTSGAAFQFQDATANATASCDAYNADAEL